MSELASRVLEVVDAPVAGLRGWDRNPRKITPKRLAQLVAMVEAAPEMLRARPLIALPDGTVIAGNQRLAAVVELGWESVPAVFVDLDESEAVEWAFRDNNPAGEPDDDLAAELLAELAGRGRALDMTGFAPVELSALLRRVAPAVDPDVVPDVPAVPRSVRGEVYELGAHRLMCGDSTNAEDVATLLDGAQPSLMLTDPPYGISLDMEWRDRAGLNGLGRAETSYMILNDGQSGDVRADWSDGFALVPSLEIAYVWHASSHGSDVQSGLERIGFEIVQQIIWRKSVFSMGRQNYQWQHEPCWYARKKGAKVPWFGGASQSTVWDEPSPKHLMGGSKEAKVDHPTQKPTALYTRPIENHLERGQDFYEPFGGSGSAIIAAEITGRRCLAMELDPRFVDVIRQRYADHVGDQTFAP